MKRIGIFQLYSEDGLVEEYIEVLLKSMEPILSRLIIVFSGELKEKELQKLSKYSDTIYKRENSGYDAGAYKDVLLKLCRENYNQWEEMILFNCTFYGPLFSWGEIFRQMDKEPVDFWGLSRSLGENRLRKSGPILEEHLQSYFLVIRKSLLHDSNFWQFWEELECPRNYYEAIENFEGKFTIYFKNKGFRYKSWLDIKGENPYIGVGFNSYTKYAYEIIRDYRFPIIKCRALSLVNFTQTRKVIDYVQKYTDYDENLILNHIKKLNKSDKWKPISTGKIETFIKKHKNIYIFGHGRYGKGIAEYLEYRNWSFNSYIVTKPQCSEEIAFEEFEMGKNDGMIVAIGLYSLEEMEGRIRRKFNEDQCLFLKDL